MIKCPQCRNKIFGEKREGEAFHCNKCRAVLQKNKKGTIEILSLCNSCKTKPVYATDPDEKKGYCIDCWSKT